MTVYFMNMINLSMNSKFGILSQYFGIRSILWTCPHHIHKQNMRLNSFLTAVSNMLLLACFYEYYLFKNKGKNTLFCVCVNIGIEMTKMCFMLVDEMYGQF